MIEGITDPCRPSRCDSQILRRRTSVSVLRGKRWPCRLLSVSRRNWCRRLDWWPPQQNRNRPDNEKPAGDSQCDQRRHSVGENAAPELERDDSERSHHCHHAQHRRTPKRLDAVVHILSYKYASRFHHCPAHEESEEGDRRNNNPPLEPTNYQRDPDEPTTGADSVSDRIYSIAE